MVSASVAVHLDFRIVAMNRSESRGGRKECGSGGSPTQSLVLIVVQEADYRVCLCVSFSVSTGGRRARKLRRSRTS